MLENTQDNDTDVPEDYITPENYDSIGFNAHKFDSQFVLEICYLGFEEEKVKNFKIVQTGIVADTLEELTEKVINLIQNDFFLQEFIFDEIKVFEDGSFVMDYAMTTGDISDDEEKATPVSLESFSSRILH